GPHPLHTCAGYLAVISETAAFPPGGPDPPQPPAECFPAFFQLRVQFRVGMDQPELEVAEEQLLAEARPQPGGLAGLLRDPPRLGFADLRASAASCGVQSLAHDASPSLGPILRYSAATSSYCPVLLAGNPRMRMPP